MVRTQIAILPEHYQEFREFLEAKCGILLGDNKQYLVTSRIGHFLRDHQMSSLDELIQQMKRPGQSRLMQEVIDAMTTNETLWFRDGFPFDILKRTMFNECLEKRRDLKIWSAACSSGQEPYSIAITWDEFKKNGGAPLNASLQIVATDISHSILDNARLGIYDELSLRRGLSDHHRRNYFTPASEEGKLQVVPAVKRMINFRFLNLLDASFGFSKYDIVFCRNVLIYFSPELKRQVIQKIAKVLNPGGYLFLGASESMSGLSDEFEMVRCNPGLVYRLK